MEPRYGVAIEVGDQHDNLTDWGLRQFREHYGDAKITKRDIFHYTYAVLHHPAYRASYEINLKREFPRLPFYGDFRQWARWGRALMELHLDYEQAAPLPSGTMTLHLSAAWDIRFESEDALAPGRHRWDGHLLAEDEPRMGLL